MEYFLTPEEQAIIEKHRENRTCEQKKTAKSLFAIKIALDFESWRQRTGADKTYQTFTHGFGYGNPELYELVLAIIRASRGEIR
jgi:hypothetical protein